MGNGEEGAGHEDDRWEGRGRASMTWVDGAAERDGVEGEKRGAKSSVCIDE